MNELKIIAISALVSVLTLIILVFAAAVCRQQRKEVFTGIIWVSFMLAVALFCVLTIWRLL
jgi:hypothetical protein